MKKLLVVFLIFAQAIPVYAGGGGQGCCASAATSEIEQLADDVSTNAAI